MKAERLPSRPQVKILRTSEEALLPVRATPGSVGLDLFAYIISETRRNNTILIPARDVRAIPTGLTIECSPGWFATVCSRSGLAARHIHVANQPGIIDPDYRGELKVLLQNDGHEPYWVRHGDRIAQLIFLPAIMVDLIEVDFAGALSPSVRADAGFGSTGR